MTRAPGTGCLTCILIAIDSEEAHDMNIVRVMQFERLVRDSRQAMIDHFYRRVREELAPFNYDLDYFLATLFSGVLPTDWRAQWHAFVADQATKGFPVVPQSVREMEVWIEAWARFCGLLPEGSAGESLRDRDSPRYTEQDRSLHHGQPAAALRYVLDAPDDFQSPVDDPVAVGASTGSSSLDPLATTGHAEATVATGPKSRGGDQTQFATEAEEIISRETGVPRNVGPKRQTIPGTGDAKIRIPDLKFRGPRGSVRHLNAVVEVKATRDPKTGKLSGRSWQQIEDAVDYILELRERANLVKDPVLKARLKTVQVRVYSDLPKPTKGLFAELIKAEYLDWQPIPRAVAAVASVSRGAGNAAASAARPRAGSRPVVSGSPRSIGKPGLGAAKNLALGIVISLVEADIANAAYRDSATVLNDLLDQIARNEDVDESDWQTIEAKLNEIANMKQTWFGTFWGFVSYGQGSLPEKQATALILLAHELADKYGYRNVRTWSDTFDGRFGHFEKRR